MKNARKQFLLRVVLSAATIYATAKDTIASIIEPTMSVKVYKSIDDYLPDIPGNECLWIYNVMNTSLDNKENYMVSFGVNAGRKNGIIQGYPGPGCTYTLHDEYIFFKTEYPVPSGATDRFAFIAKSGYGTSGIAYANNQGPPIGRFRITETDVPVPEPGTLALLALGSMLLRKDER